MNKATNKLIPELRFPEFVRDGEWGEKFVEDFFLVGSSKRVLQEDWTNQGIPFYRTRELVSLSKNEPFGSEIFISEELFLEISEKYGLPSEGDFLVSGVGTLGICYQIQADDKFYFKDGNVLWFKLESGLNSTYFKYCFQSDHIQNQIFAQASISTVGTYTIQNAKKTTLWYPPTTNEQQKIASCLSSLDEVIAAHSQKLEALKTHKKGLMQNLFTQEGEIVPKYRFPEFVGEGDWVKNSLDNLGNFLGGGTPDRSNSDFWLGNIPWISSSDIGEDDIHSISISRFINDQSIKQSATKIIPKGSVLFISRVGVGKLAISREELCTSQDFTNFIPKAVLNYFIGYYFSANKHLLQSLNQGTSIKGFSKSDLENFILSYPKNQKEQQKIASCLTSLDALITAQVEKIEQLKWHKKGLMQGLFPKND